MMYISAWEAHTGNVFEKLETGVESGEIDGNDTVWQGPSGDYVVAASPADLDEDYAEYSDSGTVAEWLAQAEA